MNETKVLLANVTYEIKTLDEKWVLWIRIASKPALSINKDCSSMSRSVMLRPSSMDRGGCS